MTLFKNLKFINTSKSARIICSILLSDPLFFHLKLFLENFEIYNYDDKLGIYIKYNRGSFADLLSACFLSINCYLPRSRIFDIIAELKGTKNCYQGSIYRTIDLDHLVFENGMLELSTMRLKAFNPLYCCIRCFPFAYNNTNKNADHFFLFLRNFCAGDEYKMVLIRCMFNLLLRTGVAKQVYVCISGSTDTGKDLLLRLFQMFAGSGGFTHTTLKQINYVKLPTLRGKRLIIISDSETYTGSLFALKHITTFNFTPSIFGLSSLGDPHNALVLFEGNLQVFGFDKPEPVSRRVVKLICGGPIIKPEDIEILLAENNGKWSGSFYNEFNPILNWSLSLPSDLVAKFFLEAKLPIARNEDDLNEINITNFIKRYLKKSEKGFTFLSNAENNGLYDTYVTFASSKPSIGFKKAFVQALCRELDLLGWSYEYKRKNRGFGFRGVSLSSIPKKAGNPTGITDIQLTIEDWSILKKDLTNLSAHKK